MMSNIVERAQHALGKIGNSPWLPELTTELVQAGWRDLYRNAGLSPNAYGTARAMTRDACTPQRIVARLPMLSDTVSREGELQVEILEVDFARRYVEAGVRFYTAEELEAPNVLAQLGEAINVIKLVPALFTTVAALVRSVHVLSPTDDAYDVSFSEPHVPFSIFVSVPQASSVTSPLRVAESIVHEAMHLQLTLIEQMVPLVLLSHKRYFSPWRDEYRSPQGILHALYVFRVIHEFWGSLVSAPIFIGERSEHVNNRQNQIAAEMEQVQSFQDCPDLTPHGLRFVRSLLASPTLGEELRRR